MGIKDLWTILAPHCERKPVKNELRGKKVAIDLAGWICESSNVVDYFVHSHFYLRHVKNMNGSEEVIPVFVLDGASPELKSETILKRKKLPFKGVKSKKNQSLQPSSKAKDSRTGFAKILKQCELLLLSMGIQCVKAPGEAEAYCSLLNKKEIVDGVISQDSDCFAYGALCVYRNFSITTQNSSTVQRGYVDVYDIKKIHKAIGIGQKKIIAMALLCGCDYCPDGVSGVGRGSVLKLFQTSTEDDILQKLKAWRQDDSMYKALETEVNNKNICPHCGHSGNRQEHARHGCKICGTYHDCDRNLWREKRNALKSELELRRKALKDELFPSQEIIDEFLSEPKILPVFKIQWNQPNFIMFGKFASLLQWSAITCFKKFFPILTRWQLLNSSSDLENFVIPSKIKKKRIIKGKTCLEVLWVCKEEFWHKLNDQLSQNLLSRNSDDSEIEAIWTTFEPLNILEQKYQTLVGNFLSSLRSPMFSRNIRFAGTDGKIVNNHIRKRKKKTRDANDWNERVLSLEGVQCSTPKNSVTSELESDSEDISAHLSHIINDIVQNLQPKIIKYSGRSLHYGSTETARDIKKKHYK